MLGHAYEAAAAYCGRNQPTKVKAPVDRPKSAMGKGRIVSATIAIRRCK